MSSDGVCHRPESSQSRGSLGPRQEPVRRVRTSIRSTALSPQVALSHSGHRSRSCASRPAHTKAGTDDETGHSHTDDRNYRAQREESERSEDLGSGTPLRSSGPASSSAQARDDLFASAKPNANTRSSLGAHKKPQRADDSTEEEDVWAADRPTQGGFQNAEDDAAHDSETYSYDDASPRPEESPPPPPFYGPTASHLKHFDFPQPGTGKPYSFPDAQRYYGKTGTQLKEIRLNPVEPATYVGTESTRPLLLTFDAFDTLFTPRESIPAQYRETALEHGIDRPETEIMSSFKSAFKAMSAEHPNYGLQSGLNPETWWHELIARTFPDVSAAVLPALQSDLYDRFSSDRGYRLFDDVQPLLDIIGLDSYQARTWPPRRTMLGIVTNSDPRVRRILKSLGIKRRRALYPPRHAPLSRKGKWIPTKSARMSFVVTSYQARAEKSVADLDGTIWKRANEWAQDDIKRLSNPVKRLTRSGSTLLTHISDFHHLHVGDELQHDVFAPMAAGWDAIWLKRDASERHSVQELEVPHSLRPKLGEKVEVTIINNLGVIPELVRRPRLQGTHQQDRSRFYLPASSRFMERNEPDKPSRASSEESIELVEDTQSSLDEVVGKTAQIAAAEEQEPKDSI